MVVGAAVNRYCGVEVGWRFEVLKIEPPQQSAQLVLLSITACAGEHFHERYDLNLWIGDSFEGATYLPR